jgi:hypothetical protein
LYSFRNPGPEGGSRPWPSRLEWQVGPEDDGVWCQRVAEPRESFASLLDGLAGAVGVKGQQGPGEDLLYSEVAWRRTGHNQRRD